MKKTLFLITLLASCTFCRAAETIYKGDTKIPICYYQQTKFYSDAACKKMIFHHTGIAVSDKANPPYGTGLYRFMNGGIYKGPSFAQDACIATLVETKLLRGNIKEGKIHEGYVIVRNVSTKYIKGVRVITSYKTTRNGINPVKAKVLYTIKDRKMYRGDSTDAKDCVLNWTGDFSGPKLLFMAINWAK